MGTGNTREAALVKRWRQGQAAAARQKLELCSDEGPDPEQAVAEALSAFELLSGATAHPSQRDPVSERDVTEVRRRWARIQKRARKELATLAEAPELIDGLEAVIARAAEVQRARPTRTPRTKKATKRRATAAKPRRPSKRKAS